MAEGYMAEKKIIPTWGYSKDGPKLLDLKEGDRLPDGHYANPAMVPGSEAEKKHRDDAEREGAKVLWDEQKLDKKDEKKS
jgi:hypothetical protein